MIQKKTRTRIIAIISFALVITAVTFGFGQANLTHSAGFVGSGYGVKSPYEVSHIKYVLDLEDPSTFNSVSFVLDQDLSQVKAGISRSGNGKIIWADECDLNGPRWTCSFADTMELLAADWLHVDSAQ